MNCFFYDDDLNVYHTLLDALKSKKKIWFYYHDDVFRSVDWKVEPFLSLDELYKNRAQQIRDSYPYLVLCYSGGNDSTNILETFYYNNIHIDEILVVGALSQDPAKGSDFNHNGDLYHNAFPTLNSFNLPNTKITIVDYTEFFRDDKVGEFSLFKQHGKEWTKHIGGYHSVHNLFWYDLRRLIGSHGKETAVIFGADKPVVKFHDNLKAYITFGNLSYTDYGNIYHDENFHRVNFYADKDPEAIDIMRKQAHVVKRVKRSCLELGKQIPETHRIIYNPRNKLVFQSEKSKTSLLSARDMFMITKQDSEIYRMYKEGINYLNSQIPDIKKMPVFSKPYWLE